MKEWLSIFKSNLRRRGVLAAFALLSPMLYASSPIHFQSKPKFSVIVPVYLNESGPYPFLLDTGSNRTLVSLEILKQLKASYLNHEELNTAAGVSSVECYRVDTLRVGDKFAHNLDVLAVAVVGEKNKTFLGVLGQDFLREFDYLLDYRNRQLIFAESGEFSPCLDKSLEVYAIQSHSRRMLIMLPPQALGRKPPLLVLDSGATGLILFNQKPDAYGLDLDYSSIEPQSFLTLAGSSRGVGGILRTLRLKASKLENQQIFMPNRLEPETERVEDGLLPTSYFQSLYVCNSKNLVALNPVWHKSR